MYFFNVNRAMKTYTAVFFISLFSLIAGVVFSCKKEADPIVKSSAKDLSDFRFVDLPNATPTLDPATNTYSVTVAAGTNVKALKATFVLPTGAMSRPESGSVQDFTNPVSYVVTAEDGTTRTYTVNVLVQVPPKSSEKQLVSFVFSTLSPVVRAAIDQTTKKITATLPTDARLTALVPTVTVSAKATVAPASGTVQNFTAPVSYTVTAEDGSSQIYEVTVGKSVVTAVPTELGLSSFYKKYVDAVGIPVVSSAKVPDAALIQAGNIVRQMLDKRPDVIAKMRQNKLRVAVMAESELTVDIPEHSDLYTAFPGTDWNTRARGLGATLQRPVCSCAEENLLCYPTDRYLGEDILVHEFAHGIHQLGINYVDSGFDKELEGIYKEALANGLWTNTYAATNYGEYWAEGVQTWFDLNKEAIPTNTVHNQINTREELRVYDPKLYELISRYFNVPTSKVSCQAGK